MMVMLVGGSRDGEIVSIKYTPAKTDVRIKIDEVVEFYELDPKTLTTTRHARGLAHYSGDRESADSLIDADLSDVA